MEQKIRECIGEFISTKKEISVSKIQERVNCDKQYIIDIIDTMGISSLVSDDLGEPSNKSLDLTDLSLSEESNTVAKLSNKDIPMIVDAKIYQMQSNFSEMAHQLWDALAIAAQKEIDQAERQFEKKIRGLSRQLEQLKNESTDLNSSLQEVSDKNLALENHAIAINKQLSDLQQEIVLAKQENKALLDVNDNMQTEHKKLHSFNVELENKFTLVNTELTNQSKIAKRLEKEKDFLTQEFKSTQKELMHADAVISDLYESNLVDNNVLEKLGYKKHKRNLNSQSLTNKLFKDKK